MNKHQIKSDLQRIKPIKTSTDTSNNIIKKIKLETNESPTNLLKPLLSPLDCNPTGIVDTYFAAKMADRVSCDICHKVRISFGKKFSKDCRGGF